MRLAHLASVMYHITVRSLQELFESISSHTITDFSKETYCDNQ